MSKIIDNLADIDKIDAVETTANEAATDGELALKQPILASSYAQIADASLGTGTHTFNFANGDMQQLTVTGDITLAFSGFVSGKVCTMIIDLINAGAWTITYPSGILSTDKTNPEFTTSGSDRVMIIKDKDDIYSIFIVGLNIGVAV